MSSSRVVDHPRRRDAVRNRDRIVEVARRLLDEGRPLQFNDIARQAEVGIGTVYRHFSSPEALREEATLVPLQNLLARLDHTKDADPWARLTDFLHTAVLAQRDDPALASVVAQAEDALEDTAALRTELTTRFERLIRDAQSDGALRTDVTVGDVTSLLCGIAYAMRINTTATGHAGTEHYLDVLLAGLHT